MWQLNWGMAALGGLLGVLIAWSASPLVATILPLLFAFIGGAGGLSLLKMDLSKSANILKLQTTGNAFIFCCSACLVFLLLALLVKPLLDNLESTPSGRHPIEGKNFTSDDYINQIALRRRLDLVKASDKEITAVLSTFTNVDSAALLNSLTQTAKDFRTEVEKLSDADRKTFLGMSEKNSFGDGNTYNLWWATSGYLAKIDAYDRVKDKLTTSYFRYLAKSFAKIRLASFNFHFEQDSDVAFSKQHASLIDAMTKLLIAADKLGPLNFDEDRRDLKSLDSLIQASAFIKETPQIKAIADTGLGSSNF